MYMVYLARENEWSFRKFSKRPCLSGYLNPCWKLYVGIRFYEMRGSLGLGFNVGDDWRMYKDTEKTIDWTPFPPQFPRTQISSSFHPKEPLVSPPQLSSLSLRERGSNVGRQRPIDLSARPIPLSSTVVLITVIISWFFDLFHSIHASRIHLPPLTPARAAALHQDRRRWGRWHQHRGHRDPVAGYDKSRKLKVQSLFSLWLGLLQNPHRL